MILAWLAACATSTGGERVTFDAEARALVDAPGPLVYDDDGWTVTLTEAELFVGPIYLWSEEPLLEVRRRWRFGWVSTAWAQADQFDAGFITGEITDQVALDLLDPEPVALEPGEGIAGPSRSAEIWLEPGPGGAPTLTLVGEAEQDGLVVPFVGELTLDEAWFDVEGGENPLIQRRVRGIPWDARLSRRGGVEIAVDPTALLRGLDWEALAATPLVDGRHAIAPGTQPGNVLRDRVRQTGRDRAWTLLWWESR
jgi:hypothetical protein